jgi:hypothetical protein
MYNSTFAVKNTLFFTKNGVWGVAPRCIPPTGGGGFSGRCPEALFIFWFFVALSNYEQQLSIINYTFSIVRHLLVDKGG